MRQVAGQDRLNLCLLTGRQAHYGRVSRRRWRWGRARARRGRTPAGSKHHARHHSCPAAPHSPSAVTAPPALHSIHIGGGPVRGTGSKPPHTSSATRTATFSISASVVIGLPIPSTCVINSLAIVFA